MATKEMNKRPQEGTTDGSMEREPSNLAHMKLLYKEIFDMYTPTPAMPMNMTLEDIKEATIWTEKYLKDVMEGIFIKSDKDIDSAFRDAIESGVLSTSKSDKNHVGNYMYMRTDKNHMDYFKHKENKEYIWNLKGIGNPKADIPKNIININDIRRKKND